MSENKNHLSAAHVGHKAGHGCATAVIVETALACDSNINECLSRLYGTPGEATAAHHRYDLLSLPDLAGLLNEERRYAMLVEDIQIAVRLHHTERLAVIADNSVGRALAAKLAADPKLNGLTVSSDCPMAHAEGSDMLVIGCMDWRLHGPQGGFERKLAAASGRSGCAVMTLPGAAKDIVPGSTRGQVALNIVRSMVKDRGLKEIILAAHTDCGKYGGRAAFAGPDDEMIRLTDDMRAAAEFLGREAGVKVRLAVAGIGDNCTDKIVEVR